MLDARWQKARAANAPRVTLGATGMRLRVVDIAKILETIKIGLGSWSELEALMARIRWIAVLTMEHGPAPRSPTTASRNSTESIPVLILTQAKSAIWEIGKGRF